MYHSILDRMGERPPYFEIHTRPDVFAKHMKFLSENHYRTVDLANAATGIPRGGDGGRQVCITFDDGYRDFYTHALPILEQYGFTATVFVITRLAGDERVRKGDQEFLTWREIRQIRSAGIRIGSHTVTHPELRGLTGGEIERELRQSKQALEDKLGEQIFSFSYPYAFPEWDVQFAGFLKSLLRAEGYRNGVTTILGTSGPQYDPFFLPRLPVNSFDDIRLFQAKLEGAYDWLHVAQLLSKRIRHAVTRSPARKYLSCRSTGILK